MRSPRGCSAAGRVFAARRIAGADDRASLENLERDAAVERNPARCETGRLRYRDHQRRRVGFAHLHGAIHRLACVSANGHDVIANLQVHHRDWRDPLERAIDRNTRTGWLRRNLEAARAGFKLRGDGHSQPLVHRECAAAAVAVQRPVARREVSFPPVRSRRDDRNISTES